MPFQTNLFEHANDLADIGLHPWLRDEALFEDLTKPQIIELCDKNLPDMKKLHAFSGATSPSFDPPNLAWFGLKKPQQFIWNVAANASAQHADSNLSHSQPSKSWADRVDEPGAFEPVGGVESMFKTFHAACERARNDDAVQVD